MLLTDFGIATLEGDPSLTVSGVLLGAPAYIALERVRGHHDDTGFSVAVPDAWHVSRQGQRVYFREPDGSRFLLIDPVADWQEQEQRRRSTYPDYRRIRIAPVEYYRKATDWEFTYTGRNGRVHVLNRGVVTGDDKAYGIYWSTPDSQWSGSLRYFEVSPKRSGPLRAEAAEGRPHQPDPSSLSPSCSKPSRVRNYAQSQPGQRDYPGARALG